MVRVTAAWTNRSTPVQRLSKPIGSAQWRKITSIFCRLYVAVACSLVVIPAKATAQQRDYSSRNQFAESIAQVIPDETLPTSVEQLREIMNINGGERAGNNLFHSFEEFSIPEEMEAVFENATDIENIFTRITGADASTINGILRTQGGANFFLVNPNGIIFGENARLDVGGSFVATTANSIQFEGGTEFAASDSATEPVITIERPIGLSFDGNNGAIQVNGSGHQITNDSTFSPVEFAETTGISIQSNQTLALVGNEINLDGGIINSEGSKVYLMSLYSGSVGINSSKNGFTLLDNNSIKHENINLNQQSLIDASGKKLGIISLTGKNINLNDASFILNQSRGSSSGGSIDLKASESLTLAGSSSNGEISSGVRAETLENGKGADITISANQLLLQDAARIQAFTFGDEIGGSIKIEIYNTTKLDDSFINASTRGKGTAGNLELSTSQLELTNVGIISSSSTGVNNGNGGQVIVNADSIYVSGGSKFSRSNISTSSFTTGNAGNLTVNTKQLTIADGGSISSSSFNNGNAGNLVINASKLIDVSGNNPDFEASSNSESTIRTAVQIGKGRNLPKIPTGNAGSLTINTPVLNISQKGVISVENEGTGNGGVLSINTEQLNLSEAGNITAATASGTGGNINLDTENLQIDGNSEITATAENDGDGGNINISTTALLAKKNSEVTANAFAGTGGNIQIDTQGLFLFPNSTIQASSELGIDGRVKINTLDTNLQRDLELSELNLVTSEESLANSCLARRNEQQGSFYVSQGSNLSTVGKFGFYDSGSITGINESDNSFTSLEQRTVIESQSSNSPIPAQQAVKTKDGRIFLVSAPLAVKSLVCN